MKKIVNIREWEPTDSDAVDVKDTKMLSTTARETPDTVSAKNRNVEHVTVTPDPGPLGAKGRH